MLLGGDRDCLWPGSFQSSCWSLLGQSGKNKSLNFNLGPPPVLLSHRPQIQQGPLHLDKCPFVGVLRKAMVEGTWGQGGGWPGEGEQRGEVVPALQLCLAAVYFRVAARCPPLLCSQAGWAGQAAAEA